MYSINAWDTIDFASIAIKNVVVNNIVVSIVELDSAIAKLAKVITSSLRAFFIYNFVNILKSIAK